MTNEISNFFPIEGLDGVGKTSVVDGLRARGLTIMATPPDEFKKLRPVFEHKDLRLRFLYYLMGVMYAGKIAKSLNSSEGVVCDRYLLTTVAAHQAMGLSDKWLSMCMPLIKTVPKPENTFLITCEEEERLRRMYTRGANKVDKNNLLINDKILRGYFEWSRKLGHTLTTVDATNIGPQEVVEEIIFKMKGNGHS